MEDPRIADIPSIKKPVEDAKMVGCLNQVFPLLRPFLELLGVNTKKMEETLRKSKELITMTEEFASIPDRFNDIFACRGWIIYDLMNWEVAKSAVRRAEAGDVEGAEEDLVNYFSPEEVENQLRIMGFIETFRPRMRLAQKALEDYRDKRYHACVLVILALLDGFVNDLHERRKGFFAEGTSMEAWDSMAAHSKGLNALAAILKTGRNKTREETITVPYRHGIVHGRDLGYDNRIVAAKTWATLFATRDWALKAEKGALSAPPEEKKPTFGDVIQELREHKDFEERLKAWQPRSVQPGKNIPATGGPDSYDENTPERRLVEFLNYWKAKNYGYMAEILAVGLDITISQFAGEVRELFDEKRLTAFRLIEISDVAVNVTEIQTELVYEENGEEIKKSIRYRMVYQNPEDKLAIRGKAGGVWIIVNWRYVL